MANALVDLVSLQEAKDFFAGSGQAAPGDSALATLITGVSAILQSTLSRNLVSQAYTATLSGPGGFAVSLPNTPITAVAAVSVDGVAVPASADPRSWGFTFSETQVLLRGGQRFTRGVQNVTISYTAGFATIPDDIKRATFEGLTAVLAQMDLEDPRAIEFQAGGTRFKLANGDMADLSSICMTANITSILGQRMRVVPC